MRYPLFILFIASLELSVYSQQTFNLDISSPLEERPFQVVETGNGTYYLSACLFDLVENRFATFYKISNNGVIIDEEEMKNPDGDCYFLNLIQTDENSLVAIGEWNHPGENSDLCYLGLDTSLNITWEKHYPIPGNHIMFQRSCMTTKGTLVTIVSAVTDYQPSTSVLVFFEASLTGDSIYSRIEIPLWSAFVFDVDEYNSGYISVIRGLSSDGKPSIVTLDEYFNVVSLDSIPNGLDLASTLMVESDSLFYLSGNYYQNYQTDIGIEMLNRDFNQLCFTYTGDPMLRDYGGAEQSLDSRQTDTIFTAGTNNLDPSHVYYGLFDSWYCLNNYDSALNLRWTKFYGGNAYYFMCYFLATSDGGALMSGTKYDDQNPDDLLDIHIVKVDAEGLVTGISDNSTLLLHDAIVYPNPGSDYLIIQSGPQIAGAGFRMFDMQGKEVLKATLNQTQCRPSTVNLSPGNYVWSITMNGRTIESGKWVKER